MNDGDLTADPSLVTVGASGVTPTEYLLYVKYQCKFPLVGHEHCKEAYRTLGGTLCTLISDKDQQITELEAEVERLEHCVKLYKRKDNESH